MQFEFSNINTQYNQADLIASITKENKRSAASNIDSAYNSSALNLDAAVLSISSEGSARINAMLTKSIQLRATSINPNLSAADRLKVSNELRNIRREIGELRTADNNKKTVDTESASKKAETTDVDTDTIDVEKMMEESTNNILKHAEESMQTQMVNREHILQLL